MLETADPRTDVAARAVPTHPARIARPGLSTTPAFDLIGVMYHTCELTALCIISHMERQGLIGRPHTSRQTLFRPRPLATAKPGGLEGAAMAECPFGRLLPRVRLVSRPWQALSVIGNARFES
jgi:hypothetical protein